MNKNPHFVSCQWLLEHLEDPSIVVIDCRFSLTEPDLGKKLYQISHIKGAYYLDLNKDLSSSIQKHGGRHPLPNITKLADKLAEMGVNYQSTLVVTYDDSRFAFASRLWWLLRYFGHEKVAVLDGGFGAWEKANYPLTNIIPSVKDAQFAPQIQSNLLVDIEIVKDRKDLPQVTLVDSRDRDRYLGIREPIDRIAGHISGAVNYPWKEVTNSDGYLNSSPEQQQRWSNLENSEEIIVYCGSGVTACVNLLSLELAGIHQGKLYAGSWSDWISYQVND
ncbi:MAG: sulfurtransferase [Cyanobacteria bacterium P01_A01_bin.84]